MSRSSPVTLNHPDALRGFVLAVHGQAGIRWAVEGTNVGREFRHRTEDDGPGIDSALVTLRSLPGRTVSENAVVGAEAAARQRRRGDSMTWFHWLLIALFALEPFLKILLIGSPRKPITRADAAFALVVNALLIWCVVAIATP